MSINEKETTIKKDKNETIDEEILLKMYIEQLDEIELLIYKIAEEHLESSFDVSKSIGYLEWKKEKTKN